MASKDKTLYSEDSIESLSPLEFTRKRPGVYAGSVEYSTQLVIELFSNALDEHNLGHGNLIEVNYKSDSNEIQVQDNAQGFPVNVWRDDGKTVLQASFDTLNTSGKYSKDGVYGASALGLNGIGSKICTYLSHYLVVETQDGSGRGERVFFEEGVFQKREIFDTDKKTGTLVSFQPSEEFFTHPEPDIKVLCKLFDDTCGLCPNLNVRFYMNGKDFQSYCHPEGLVSLVDNIVGKDISIISSPLRFQAQQDKYSLDCGLSYTSKSGNDIIAYVNYGLTDQGPHITALKSAITRVMNKWAREKGLLKEKETNIDGTSLQEGLVLVFNLVAPNISYDAQTKSRIVSNDFVSFLIDSFSTQLELWLDTNPQDGQNIIEKALIARKATEAAKKAREAVKQKANAKQDKVFKMPTKLTDCWTKDRSKAELLIAEGLSAASGLVAARNSEFQAVYGVRGKMLSILKTTPDKIMKNQEINNIIVALGLDYSPATGKMVYDKSKLRYDKIIACADADFDGYAIENLLFNILWYLCPELVINGHVYSSVPPLFRVTTKKNEYIYLKDQQALDDYKQAHVANIKTIGREKGLGEMDAEELSYSLLDPATRNVVQLEVNDVEQTSQLFQDLYGKNVEPRVKFILEHSEEAQTD